jgi:succinate dehydrogenase/fumarate reductase flavoprotein subunit
MAIRISVTSKLDGIRSWSLEAIATCPGSVGADGELVPACKGCYATTGNYRFANVKAPRQENRQDWKRAEWVDEMVKELDSDRYFRWFDSGDLYDLRLAHKVYQVMARTPWCQHWLPTRMHKFGKFAQVLRMMEQLPNVVVRRSSDNVDGTFEAGVHGSTIVPTASQAPAGVKVCQAYENDGKCSGCRACWDKSVSVVGYVAHGRKMTSVLKREGLIAIA